MSIKTTHIVTREFAIAAIQQKLQTANDIQLELLLEEAIHNGFYNFAIVSEEVLNNFKQNCPYLDNLTNLPEYNDA